MSFGLSFGAAAGAGTLQDIILRKQKEMEFRAEQERAMRALDLQTRGQDITARGQDMQNERWSTDRQDSLSAAAAEAQKTAAGEAQKQEIVGRLRAVSPIMARLIDAKSAGLNINDMHGVETEQEHAPHVQAERQAGLDDYESKRQLDRKYAAPTQPRDERLVQIEGPEGAATWVRESEAVGKRAAQAARAVTGAERGVLAYYNRAKDAESTISTPDQSGASLEDRVSKGGIGTQLGLQYAPNMLQSSDQQAYRQAQRAFTEARLRKESGAAIPTAEYENDAKTYFAQPGDAPETIAQKRQKRATVLEGLKFSSGRAYDEFYGESNKATLGGTEFDYVPGKGLVPRGSQ